MLVFNQASHIYPRTSITVSSYKQMCCGTFMSSLLVRTWHWLKTALSHLAHAALLSVLPPVFPAPNLLIELLDYKRRVHIKQIVRLYPPLCNRRRLLGNGLVVPVFGIKYGDMMYMRKESWGLCVSLICIFQTSFQIGYFFLPNTTRRMLPEAFYQGSVKYSCLFLAGLLLQVSSNRALI